MKRTYIHNIEEQKAKYNLSVTTLLFFSSQELELNIIKDELKSFYDDHPYPQRIIVIIGEYLVDSNPRKDELHDDICSVVSDCIPHFNKLNIVNEFYLGFFDKVGNLRFLNNALPSDVLTHILRSSMINIFLKNNGLVEGSETHHFKFSERGKHCKQFLRTGNILVKSEEIFFLSFLLLKFIDVSSTNLIYCDTASISVLAYSVQELFRRFIPNHSHIPVISFKSYSGIYEKEDNFLPNTKFLISAGTSPRLLNYLKEAHSCDFNDITVLYFLDSENSVQQIKERVLCDLTKRNSKDEGIIPIKNYAESECAFCKDNSFAVSISGDMLLPDNPNVLLVDLKPSDLSLEVKEFLTDFKNLSSDSCPIRVHGGRKNYELYIDVKSIIEGFDEETDDGFKCKLNHFIDQYIPHGLKYLVTTDDAGSIELAKHISNVFPASSKPKIFNLEGLLTEIKNLDEDQRGSVAVVSACVTNGREVCQVGQLLRDYKNLRLIYFVGIVRTSAKKRFDFLKSNLVYGRYRSNSSVFVNCYKITGGDIKQNRSWALEAEQIDLILEHGKLSDEWIQYLTERKDKVRSTEGLAEDVFLKNTDLSSLSLRKNFAFIDFDEIQVTQSVVCLIVANVLSKLRSEDKLLSNLSTSPFHISVISPLNFSRFNDGILQSSILRLSKDHELDYRGSEEASLQMCDFILSLMRNVSHPNSEALLEFLYALSIEKIKLCEQHIDEIILKSLEIEVPIVSAYSFLIKRKKEERANRYNVEVAPTEAFI